MRWEGSGGALRTLFSVGPGAGLEGRTGMRADAVVTRGWRRRVACGARRNCAAGGRVLAHSIHLRHRRAGIWFPVLKEIVLAGGVAVLDSRVIDRCGFESEVW